MLKIFKQCSVRNEVWHLYSVGKPCFPVEDYGLMTGRVLHEVKMQSTCAKPAFSKAHGIDNKADPMIVFQIDKMVVNDEFLVPEAIAIAEPLMLRDLKIYRFSIV